MRLAQKDLLDFCGNSQYVHALEWPQDYWPRSPAPPRATAWDESIADFKADREKLKHLIRETDMDLFATVPTGKGGQTYLRAILLVADHNAYHLGQLVAVRRALGIWPDLFPPSDLSQRSSRAACKATAKRPRGQNMRARRLEVGESSRGDHGHRTGARDEGHSPPCDRPEQARRPDQRNAGVGTPTNRASSCWTL
jgi:hypothetical protein